MNNIIYNPDISEYEFICKCGTVYVGFPDTSKIDCEECAKIKATKNRSKSVADFKEIENYRSISPDTTCWNCKHLRKNYYQGEPSYCTHLDNLEFEIDNVSICDRFEEDK